MMKLKKRGQITYFVIVGIVLVIIVAFIIYARTLFVKKEAEKEVERVGEQSFSTAPVESYVTGCLRRTAEDALELLGRHGGVLYTSDGGTTLDGGVSYISYSIEGNGYNIKTDIEAIPDMTTAANILPVLFYEPQKRHDAMDRAIRIWAFNNLGNCLNVLSFPGLIIDTSTLKGVDVTITEEDVGINLNYSIDIEDLTTGKKAHLENFKTDINVRLKKIHSIVSHTLDSDISDPDFDIESAGSDGITLSKIDTVAYRGLKQDIIKVTDTQSKLKGKDYEFYFAREYTKPVTEIKYKINDGGAEYIIPLLPPTTPTTISINENQKIIFKITAKDRNDDDGVSQKTYLIQNRGGLNWAIDNRFSNNNNIVSSQTSEHSWQTNYINAGTYHLNISATSNGVSNFKLIDLTVHNVNRPPQIISPYYGELVKITTIHTYIYSVAANDLDGDTLTYSLTTKPDGMTIGSTTGDISWTPSADQINTQYDVVVLVNDGQGGSNSISFKIKAEGDGTRRSFTDCTTECSDFDGCTCTIACGVHAAGRNIVYRSNCNAP